MIKLVVFDWNGTLFADNNAIMHAANSRFRLINKPELTLDQYREAFEIPMSKTFLKLGIDPESIKTHYVALTTAFHETYEPLALKVKMRSGAREVLDYLDANKISNIILSNHTEDGIKIQLERLNIDKHFKAVLANEDIFGSHHNGKQHRLEKFLVSTKFKPNETLIIGDTSEEVLIGKALGLNTVGLTGGFSTEAKILGAKPDVLIHKLRDIIDVIEEL